MNADQTIDAASAAIKQAIARIAELEAREHEREGRIGELLAENKELKDALGALEDSARRLTNDYVWESFTHRGAQEHTSIYCDKARAALQKYESRHA